MFKYTFILLFLASSCSLYNFSDSKDLIDDIFDKENESQDNIFLISPSTEETLHLDNLKLDLFLQDPLGISDITISLPTGTPIVIALKDSPKKYNIYTNIQLKNGGTYNTSHGKYDIKISYDNSDSVTFEKDFTLTIKRLTTDYHFSPSGTTKPPVGDPWRDTDLVRISDYGTGAPLQKVKITGSLGNHTYDGPFTGSVEIRYDTLSPTVPAGTVGLNFSIISDTGGTSMETHILTDP